MDNDPVSESSTGAPLSQPAGNHPVRMPDADDAGVALGERRDLDTPIASAESTSSDDQVQQQTGLTWRHIVGIIGLIAGLLVMIVYLTNPEQPWGIVQKPLIGVATGLGAWFVCFRWPSKWIWSSGSLTIAVSALLLLATAPWQQAVGLALIGFGSGAWCAWGYRDKKRSGWFSAFLSMTTYLVFIAAAVLQAYSGNPWYLVAFGLASCGLGGFLIRQTLARPLKPPTWWRIRHAAGRVFLLTGILSPYVALILARIF